MMLLNTIQLPVPVVFMNRLVKGEILTFLGQPVHQIIPLPRYLL